MPHLDRLVNHIRFGVESDFQQEISSRLSAAPGAPVVCHPIGESEQGRPVVGYTFGSGTRTVSLIAGAHSDEPVGPETLRLLVRTAVSSPKLVSDLLEEYSFVVVPHVNPDGEMRNRAWIRKWPSLDAYLKHAFRELPGRDLEFGFPAMRRENEALSTFLSARAPFDLHMSLHGMAFSDGGLLLIERHWIERTADLRDGFRRLMEKNGLRLHDHDRGGEKGFEYIGPGFTTTPEGRAMKAHFEAKGDETTAEKFHLSSMEYVRTLGGDPLCLVTELPLFLLTKVDNDETPGVPETYLRFKGRLAELKVAETPERAAEILTDEFGTVPVPAAKAVRMQLNTMSMGLKMVSGSGC